jgi:ABC-type transport system involved in cytochrome c biogenesis permease subunit
MPDAALDGITHACFGLSYATAFGLELLRLRSPRQGVRYASLFFGAAGLFAHTIYLARHQPTPAAPYGSLLLLAWVLAVFYFYGALHHARKAWAIFVLPVVIGLTMLSYLLIDPRSAPITVPDWLTGERRWGRIHGYLLEAAAVGVSVAFLASVMYLVQARRMRVKSFTTDGFTLLSLERLESMNRRAVTFALPLLTAGLLLGGVLLRGEPSTAGWLRVKVLGTAGLWLVCGLLVYLRVAAAVPGRRLALLTIAAFALMVLVLAAVHPFAGNPLAEVSP